MRERLKWNWNRKRWDGKKGGKIEKSKEKNGKRKRIMKSERKLNYRKKDENKMKRKNN